MESKENFVLLNYKLPTLYVPPRWYALGVLQSTVGFQTLGCGNPLGHFKLQTIFQEVTHKEFKADGSRLAGQSVRSCNLKATMSM